MSQSKPEQTEKGFAARRNKSKSSRWWLKFWRKRSARRDAKRNLDGAARRHTKGWEY